jgi:hypothetical protein
MIKQTNFLTYNRSIFLESGKKIRGDNQNVLSVIKIAFHQARLSPDYVDTQGTSFYLLIFIGT